MGTVDSSFFILLASVLVHHS